MSAGSPSSNHFIATRLGVELTNLQSLYRKFHTLKSTWVVFELPEVRGLNSQLFSQLP